MKARPRRDRAAGYSIGHFGNPRYLHRAYEDERYMDVVTQLEAQIERRESLKSLDQNPGQRLARETKYNFYAKAHQPVDPDFVVVRTSPTTAVVTLFMEDGKLTPVSKELPLDEACKVADQLNRGNK